jgi:hypothetical protein
VASLAKNYPEAWRYYRRWRILLWVGLIGLLPAEALIGAPLNRAVGSEIPTLVVFLTMTGMFLIGGWKSATFQCPACRRQFHCQRQAMIRIFSVYNPFSSRCLTCGLPKRERPAPLRQVPLL